MRFKVTDAKHLTEIYCFLVYKCAVGSLGSGPSDTMAWRTVPLLFSLSTTLFSRGMHRERKRNPSTKQILHPITVRIRRQFVGQKSNHSSFINDISHKKKQQQQQQRQISLTGNSRDTPDFVFKIIYAFFGHPPAW